MSIFGDESVDAAAFDCYRIENCGGNLERANDGWSIASDVWREVWRVRARSNLAVAEAALDREAAFRTVYRAIFEANPDGTPGTRIVDEAWKVIAALFPEGEATGGE